MSREHHPLADGRIFVRVYQLPQLLTEGYCFGKGVPITFVNVDWFEAMTDASREVLVSHIKRKLYYKYEERYLVLGDHPDFVFVIDPIKDERIKQHGHG